MPRSRQSSSSSAGSDFSSTEAPLSHAPSRVYDQRSSTTQHSTSNQSSRTRHSRNSGPGPSASQALVPLQTAVIRSPLVDSPPSRSAVSTAHPRSHAAYQNSRQEHPANNGRAHSHRSAVPATEPSVYLHRNGTDEASTVGPWQSISQVSTNVSSRFRSRATSRGRHSATSSARRRNVRSTLLKAISFPFDAMPRQSEQLRSRIHYVEDRKRRATEDAEMSQRVLTRQANSAADFHRDFIEYGRMLATLLECNLQLVCLKRAQTNGIERVWEEIEAVAPTRACIDD